VNSLRTQTWPSVFTTVPVDIDEPGVPNMLGIATVKPCATTSSAKAATLGVSPGISWMITTPGPEPLR
jgi:hypothetical protein